MRTMGRRPTGYLLQERDSRMKTLFWQFCSILPQPSRPSSFKRKKKKKMKQRIYGSVIELWCNIWGMFVSLFHSPDTALITAAHSTTPGAWVRSGTVDWPQVLCVEIDLTVLTVTRDQQEILWKKIQAASSIAHFSFFFHVLRLFLWYFFHSHYCLCFSCSMYLCIAVTCNLMGNGVIVCVCGCVSVYPPSYSSLLSHSLSHYFPSRITHVRMRSKTNTSHVSIATKLFAATWMASSAMTAVVRQYSINRLRKKDG